ncbi:hypothetical protein [Streptomyces sp. NBC_01445]|uniref:hypothetical protein n=1 Tax=Streptomyces sp. NBC_01445 TaxID=2903869 RepID=UPI002DD9CF35|nr:hypothetical protein [Streptomyces sp. NBC_01445]WSE05717.1 hypothetical protein OG574_21530 [Streptomyces sp. NBC_01445]
MTFDDATKIDVSRSTPVVTLVAAGSSPFAAALVRTTPSPECSNADDTVTVYIGTASGSYVDVPFMLLVP